MSSTDYLGDIIGGSLMVAESREICKLWLEHADAARWEYAIEQQNVLNKPSVATAKRNARTIHCRLNHMGADFWSLIVYGDEVLAAQTVLAGTIQDAPILGDFLSLVIAEAKCSHKPALTMDDWYEFFDRCCQRYPDLSALSDASRYKIGQVIYKVLADAYYLESTRKRTVQSVFVRDELREKLVATNQLELLHCLEVCQY